MSHQQEPVIFFAPVVIPVISEDHVSRNPFSLAYNLPVGVHGSFTPLHENLVEFMAAGWKKPMRIDLPVEQKKWEPGLSGLDRLLYFFHTHDIPVQGFRLSLETTITGLDVFSFLVPLVMQYVSAQTGKITADLKARWIAQTMPGIQSEAQAYGWVSLYPDHIIIYNREDECMMVSPDPLKDWQKILIRVPEQFEVLTRKNKMTYRQWEEIIAEEETSDYIRSVRQLDLLTNRDSINELLRLLRSHEAQALTIPMTEGNRSYILTYVYPRVLDNFMAYCEEACARLLVKEYAIRVVEESFTVS